MGDRPVAAAGEVRRGCGAPRLGSRPAAALGQFRPGRAVPTRTCKATLEFGSEGLTLSAGRWRPGLVLKLPYSAIIGVWNGSDIKTISSGGVLVVVVATEHDEILLLFEVAHVKAGPSERTTVEVLVTLVEQHRG